jgi:hypothetical protein
MGGVGSTCQQLLVLLLVAALSPAYAVLLRPPCWIGAGCTSTSAACAPCIAAGRAAELLLLLPSRLRNHWPTSATNSRQDLA